MPQYAMKKLTVLTAVAALLTGCAGTTSNTSTTSPSAASPSASAASTSGAAPTAEQTAWAGSVCTATTALKKNVEGLAAAVTSGGSDVSSALKAQMATIKTSAEALTTTIAAVPNGGEGDSASAAVKKSADQFKRSVDTLEASVTALEGKSGISKATALASVGTAAADSLSKLSATTQQITDAAKDGKSTLGQAFKAAPSCSSLTS